MTKLVTSCVTTKTESREKIKETRGSENRKYGNWVRIIHYFIFLNR